MKEHNYISNGNIDKRGNNLRFRQRDVRPYGRHRCKKLENGVILVRETNAKNGGRYKRRGGNIPREVVVNKISHYIETLNRCTTPDDRKDMLEYADLVIKASRRQ